MSLRESCTEPAVIHYKEGLENQFKKDWKISEIQYQVCQTKGKYCWQEDFHCWFNQTHTCSSKDSWNLISLLIENNTYQQNLSTS